MLQPDPERAVAYGIFSVQQARSAGYSSAQIRLNVRRGRWQRSGRGILEAVGRASQPGDQIVRDLLSAGPQAVVAFAAAATIHGWELPRIPPTPSVILPPGIHGRGDAWRAPLDSDEVELHGVVAVTTPTRTALDLASVSPVVLGVVVVDSALRCGVRLDDLCHRARTKRRGIRRARQALEWADPRSGSVPESRARLLFQAALLPLPVLQMRFHLAGLDMRVDFAWPEAMVVAEVRRALGW